VIGGFDGGPEVLFFWAAAPPPSSIQRIAEGLFGLFIKVETPRRQFYRPFFGDVEGWLGTRKMPPQYSQKQW
jgi:hypothetical protein